MSPNPPTASSVAEPAVPVRASRESPTSAALSIVGVYTAYFAALGIYGPFLAVYLRYHGLSPSEAAYLLAVLPIARVLVTPLWTLLADALGSARAVLRVVGVGALVGFAGVALARGQLALTLTLVVFTAFRAPASSLLDVLALEHTARFGGHFGRLRAWGTVGYTVGTFSAGLLVGRRGPDALVFGSLALLAVTAVATFALRPAAPSPTSAPAHAPREPARASGIAPRPAASGSLLSALAQLIARPRFVVFLATATLHQMGLATYDALFADHLTRLSSAEYAGVAVALGASAEVAFMARARGVIARIGLERTLQLAYAGSAVRWLVIALVRSPAVLVVVQLAHALTFGAFYMAAVALVDAESPPAVRATAQGIFATVAWGLASSGALLLAGWLEHHGGAAAIFGVASAASVLSTVLALALRPATKAPAARGEPAVSGAPAPRPSA